MHDPKVVAHEIRRPWPQRTSFSATGSTPDKTRWKIRHHHEHFEDEDRPGTCDGCREPMEIKSNWFPWWKPGSYSAFWRLAGRDFYWPSMITIWHNEPKGADALTVCRERVQREDGTWRLTTGWKWHIHHWSIQVAPLQHLRRWLLTRCEWCGGRSVKSDLVNCARGWHQKSAHWWQGERELFHRECMSLCDAHATCTCDVPVLDHDGYGKCQVCGCFRAYGMDEDRVAKAREVKASVPYGSRPPA